MGQTPDFTGYVTRYGLKCTDGRTILAHAFQDQDGAQIPLVWQHQHNSIGNVLGYLILRHRNDGMYAEGYFNETQSGKDAKIQVRHGDLNRLSIWANQLVQRGADVLAGSIKEGSLVLAGANPGAFIDFVSFEHGDSLVQSDEDAIIYTGLEITVSPETASDSLGTSPAQGAAPAVAHAVGGTDTLAPAAQSSSSGDGNGRTVEEILSTLNEEQRDVVFALLGAAVGQDGMSGNNQSGDQTGDQTDTAIEHQEGDQPVPQHRNVFDQSTDNQTPQPAGPVLTHSDMQSIFNAARKGGSLREAVEEFALAHSITNIDLMFPDAQNVTETPDFIARRQEWVANVLGGTKHTPFSRIKNLFADITLDEARARGYVKGAMKREEFFAIARRVTTPQTVYKKQKLDRDDILDITDFDVVVWLKGEMRVMLDEEVARAILIGDGRDVADPDKISEANIRPILTDVDMFVTYWNVASGDLPPNANKTYETIVDDVMTAMQYWMGTGLPTLYAGRSWITKMLLTKDTQGRRLHSNYTELASAMGVGNIVPVDAMEALATSVIGIIVNPVDYSVGTDRGGEVNFFDDFDIDYNKWTYLYETRLSGALTKFKSAIVIKLMATGTLLADPTVPTFVKTTGVVTIPTMANVSYVSVNDTTGVESGALTAGAQTAIAAGASSHIRAKAATNYFFNNNAACNWTFQRPAS
jgi:Caudovirus prohead serine protease